MQYAGVYEGLLMPDARLAALNIGHKVRLKYNVTLTVIKSFAVSKNKTMIY